MLPDAVDGARGSSTRAARARPARVWRSSGCREITAHKIAYVDATTSQTGKGGRLAYKILT
eukprot:scaffold4488_cov117-Isochrysis_galbana.AAC.2